MFSQVLTRARLFILNVSAVQNIERSFLTNHVTKRYAGHSKWANIKHNKMNEDTRKSVRNEKFSNKIIIAIKNSKNANPATNSELNSIITEAKRANVPSSTIDRALKNGLASLDNNNRHTFCFTNPLGIILLLEINTARPKSSIMEASSAVKKFGFKHTNEGLNLFNPIGIVISKPLENVENAYDKAVEDAIESNFEEVNEIDKDNYEFQCDSRSIDHCTKKLSNLGYSIEYSNVEFIFHKYIVIEDDVILENLKKLENKLESVNGFVRAVFNIR